MRSEYFPMLGALEGCSKNFVFFAKPRGLENTHDTVMGVHKLIVSTPTKRAQTREIHFKISKDMPQRWLIFPIWAKKRPSPGKEKFSNKFYWLICLRIV